jgi:DNA polymerase-3 subunit alpha
MDSVAVTDHGTCSGTYSLWKQSLAAGVAPILGCELYVVPNRIGDHVSHDVDQFGNLYYHLLVLALNNSGLHNLFRLSSLGYLQGMYYKPRVSLSMLRQYSEGLLCTTACLGSEFDALAVRGLKIELLDLLKQYRMIFADKFFVELQLGAYTPGRGMKDLLEVEGFHFDRRQLSANAFLIKAAQELNLPLVLTNDCHFMTLDQTDTHDLALAMQTNSKLSDPVRMSFRGLQVHVAEESWLRERGMAIDIPEEAFTNTTLISRMVDSGSYFEDRKNFYPVFKDTEGMTSWDYLTVVAQEGLYARFGTMPPPEYRQRLDQELRVIKQMGFSDYMLVVWQFLSEARKQGVLVGPGRGSAAGSLVAYALQITEVDPVAHGLLFSRFLNEGRGSSPLIFTPEMREFCHHYLETHQ